MITSKSGHSALVTLELRLGERRIPLTQLAHNFAIATEPVEFPPGEGEIVMSIDGAFEHIPVFLPEGCSRSDRRFSIKSIRQLPKG